MVGNQIVIEVSVGPAFRAAADVLELASELYQLIPDWHQAEREELAARADALLELVVATLAAQQQ